MGEFKQEYIMVNCQDGMYKESNNTQANCHTTVHTTKPQWGRRRTTLEKILILVCILLFILALATIIFIIIRETTPSEGDVCLTPDCVKTAARLMEGMDSTVNPCEDFFEYACGQWNRKNIIPEDAGSINTFGKLRDEVQVALKDLLEAEVAPTDCDSVVKAKVLYRSCANETVINQRDLLPLKALLTELGGWPLLDRNWDDSSVTILGLTVKMRMYSNAILIQQTVTTDDKNSERRIIGIDQPGLGMPHKDYFLKGRNDRMLVAYETFAMELAEALGGDKSYYTQEVEDMIDFEIDLANITTPSEQRRDSEAMYHKMNISSLQQNFTDWDWNRFLNMIFSNVNITINDTEEVVVYAPEYLEKLFPVLNKTPIKTIANYLIWRILMHRVASLPFKYREIKNKCNKVLYGTGQERPKWRTCVDYTNENMGMAVGRMFVGKHFNYAAKEDAEEMIANIRTAFNDLLHEVDWMDKVTRTSAKEKADAIEEKIGYPEFILNDTVLDMFYENHTYNGEQYFENVLVNLKESALANLRRLREKIDKTKWSTTPVIVNAFYSSSKNQIMFPAGILQPPFYHNSYPKSLNYGGIGMVIGHEITHGFDDRGRQFDKNGNLMSWWEPSVVSKFKSKANCIIDQYSNYTVAEVDMNLNGIKTQGENIADNGGLKQAYKAYREYVREKRGGKEEPKLPGLSHFSNDQLFFLNFAQVWCGTMRPEGYLRRIRTGRHSPGRFRVIGSVSNSKDFSRAYNCELGSPMNPKGKCAVW